MVIRERIYADRPSIRRCLARVCPMNQLSKVVSDRATVSRCGIPFETSASWSSRIPIFAGSTTDERNS